MDFDNGVVSLVPVSSAPRQRRQRRGPLDLGSFLEKLRTTATSALIPAADSREAILEKIAQAEYALRDQSTYLENLRIEQEQLQSRVEENVRVIHDLEVHITDYSNETWHGDVRLADQRDRTQTLRYRCEARWTSLKEVMKAQEQLLRQALDEWKKSDDAGVQKDAIEMVERSILDLDRAWTEYKEAAARLAAEHTEIRQRTQDTLRRDTEEAQGHSKFQNQEISNDENSDGVAEWVFDEMRSIERRIRESTGRMEVLKTMLKD
ncbi:uncharacterized protein EV422DRAFT_563982 [Fimicolochytrium jonesii]|uniref:uncharacterized protein n=1 Tax=Fimicolochytrium jonesii TaxID=1396493 RepID=UPI0022FF2718|nr:uncharacterized protein EV422DRAFT_563982 [Fimicolochytrium jonesii]KAI8826170.1 hypothetical protein EV422DRAFT_563982 [Fimicolochytrium jonesii]